MTSRRGRHDDDRGVVLILVAVFMLAILAITAMTIDLGAKRAARRSDQTVADLASLAAGSYLAGNGGANVVSNPFAACKAAVLSAQANISSFSPTQNLNSTCAAFPTDAGTGCSSTTAPLEAVFSDTDHTLTIRYPIPGYESPIPPDGSPSANELTDSRFTSSGGVDDGADRCERMRVTFSQTQPTSFARILGVNSQQSVATAVVRANIAFKGKGVAALLLLERVGCATLQTSGGGAGGEGVVVQGPPAPPPPALANTPGVIQADTAGIVGSSAGSPTTQCGDSSSSDPKNFSIYGTALPSGTPSINAASALDGTPGIVSIYSLKVGGRPAAVFPGGLSVDPTPGDVTSRQPADDKYNKPVADGGRAQISTLHSTGYARSNGGPLVTDAVLSGNQECKGTIVDVTKLAARVIYADCPTFEPAMNIFPNAERFVVRGNINIKGGNVLSLPVASFVYVRGCVVAGCGNSNKYAINVSNNAALLINTGETALPLAAGFANGTTCLSRQGLGAGGNTTQLATFSGNFTITGLVRLCQTTAYLAKDSPTYLRQSVDETGSALSENYPVSAGCAPTLPCPKVAAFDASVQVTGGSGATDWSAPNRLSTTPGPSDFVANPFEDLALWSETDSPVFLKGQGANVTEGVYFLPNSNATFTGQGKQPIGTNAQYFVRTLNVGSQGTLKLRPNPADAIKTPVAGSYSIIR